MAKNPQVNAARVSFDFHPAAHRLTGPRDSLPNRSSKSHLMHIALFVFLMFGISLFSHAFQLFLTWIATNWLWATNTVVSASAGFGTWMFVVV